MELRDYQINGINELARKAFNGLTRIIFQLATGGGKTVCFAGLVQRYITRQPKNVLILVHREELLKQARRTLYDWHGIIAEPVTAGMKHLPQSRVYVAMVETAHNRLKKNPNYFPNVGLVIVDESHLGNFRKLFQHFPCLIIGFTATPVSASKKDPLKNHFEDIVTAIDIPDLIASKALCPNRTYHVKNINRKELKIKNGEFDESFMADLMSKPKHLHNCVLGYEQHCRGQKTLVFNCNVEHSKLVCEAFVNAGYNARHLDATSTDRVQTIEWFKNTPDAILCNVGILTTGFDEPSVLAVVVNKSTLSLPLWLQMTGRGSRPFPGKSHFTIVDMGGNALHHGDWCERRDWADMFHNPDKPSNGGGVAPVKVCKECEAIIHASVKVCPHCNADVSTIVNYDAELVEFELLTNAKPITIDMPAVIEANAHRKDYYTLHQIKNKLVAQARYQWGLKRLTDVQADRMHAMYQDMVKTWCHQKQKRYNQWHRETTRKWLAEEMERVFKYQEKMQEVAA